MENNRVCAVSLAAIGAEEIIVAVMSHATWQTDSRLRETHILPMLFTFYYSIDNCDYDGTNIWNRCFVPKQEVILTLYKIISYLRSTRSTAIKHLMAMRKFIASGHSCKKAFDCFRKTR